MDACIDNLLKLLYCLNSRLQCRLLQCLSRLEELKITPTMCYLSNANPASWATQMVEWDVMGDCARRFEDFAIYQDFYLKVGDFDRLEKSCQDSILFLVRFGLFSSQMGYELPQRFVHLGPNRNFGTILKKVSVAICRTLHCIMMSIDKVRIVLGGSWTAMILVRRKMVMLVLIGSN